MEQSRLSSLNFDAQIDSLRDEDLGDTAVVEARKSQVRARISNMKVLVPERTANHN